MRCEVCNFTDDATPYVCRKNLDFVLTIIAIAWFEKSYIKINSSECHLFISGNKFEYLWAKIVNNTIWGKRTVKQ